MIAEKYYEEIKDELIKEMINDERKAEIKRSN